MSKIFWNQAVKVLENETLAEEYKVLVIKEGTGNLAPVEEERLQAVHTEILRRMNERTD